MRHKLAGVVVSLALALLLGGCATLDREECLSADWALIGQEDGSRGLLADERLARHTDACAKHTIAVDSAGYAFGHAAGVKEYCVADKGRTLGEAGREYNGVCPSESASGFVAAYIVGLTDKLDDLDFDERLAEDHLLDVKRERAEAILVGATESTLKRKRDKVEAAQDRVRQIQIDRRRVRSLISKWSRALT